MTTVGSTRPRTRIAALDVARGIAILGTLGTNIWIFTDPAGSSAISRPQDRIRGRNAS